MLLNLNKYSFRSNFFNINLIIILCIPAVLFAELGDIDNNSEINFNDLIIGLQIITKIETSDSGSLSVNNNSDRKIGIEDVIYILKILSYNYPNNEDGLYQDMLTPAYYNAINSDPFKFEVNRFIYFARKIQFHHPLEDATANIPEYSVSDIGIFGAEKGSTNFIQYHPAIDLHVKNRETNVNLYAAHDGYVSTIKDAAKYRHYISITKNVEDNNSQVIGKIVTIYANVDLDLDENDSLFMDGQSVNCGDLISKHLYADTVGGPHLHFEIRYYRKDDIGNETFYGGNSGPFGNPDFTEPSAGIWIHGYWHPNIGYGFAHHKNHGLFFQ